MSVKNIFKILISLALSVIVIYFFFSKIEAENLAKIFSKINLIYLAAGLFFYSLVMIARAFRFKALMQNKITIREVLPVVLVHNALNYILPLKLGELSYAYLMKKTGKADYTKGMSSFLVSRVFDFIIILCAFLLGALFVGSKKEVFGITNIFALSLFALSLILVGLYLLIFRHALFKDILERIFDFLNLKKGRLLLLVKKSFLNFITSFKDYRSPWLLFKTLSGTIAAYVFGFISVSLIAYSMGYFFSLKILLVFIPFGFLSGIIPVSGIAGVGAFESLWILGLLYLGYDLAQAILFSFGLHIILFSFVVIIGSIGAIFLIRDANRTRKRKSD